MFCLSEFLIARYLFFFLHIELEVHLEVDESLKNGCVSQLIISLSL